MFRGVRIVWVAFAAIAVASACRPTAVESPVAPPASSASAIESPSDDTVAPVAIPVVVRTRFDVAYASKSPTERLDLRLPASGDGPFPVVVWIHGGGWERGDRNLASESSPMRLLESGYAVASVDYRLSHEAVFPAQIDDVKAAVRFLRANAAEFRIDDSRFGAWGDSAGGHLAALLGTSADVAAFDDPTLGNAGVSSRVQAVVDWYGPSSFTTFDRQLADDGCVKRIAGAGSAESRLIGASVSDRPDLARAASPTTFVSADDPPFLIEHGRVDCIVPWQQSEELASALKASVGDENVSLVYFDGAGHGGPDFVDAANVARLIGFFDAHLR
jgi:acetyl esterase/lipase